MSAAATIGSPRSNSQILPEPPIYNIGLSTRITKFDPANSRLECSEGLKRMSSSIGSGCISLVAAATAAAARTGMFIDTTPPHEITITSTTDSVKLTMNNIEYEVDKALIPDNCISGSPPNQKIKLCVTSNGSQVTSVELLKNDGSSHFDIKVSSNFGSAVSTIDLHQIQFKPLKFLINDIEIDVKTSKKIFKGGNFSGADLRGVDFSGVDLIGANFSRADLSGVNFSGADLSGANFSRANLSGADLRGANLRGANLSGVKLSKEQVIAILDTAKSLGYRAPLAGVDFSGADLSGIDFSGADLSRAMLGGADLRGVNFSGVILEKANFSGAKLSKEQVIAILENARSLKYTAPLAGVDFSGADLSGIDFSGADLSWANFSNANLSNANLSNANLSWATLSEANLSGAKFSIKQVRDILDGASISGLPRSLAGIDLSGGKPSFDIDFSGTDFRGANFSRLDLREVAFGDIDFSYADLSRADFSMAHLCMSGHHGKVNFSRANLSNADLSDADLSDADLSDADLSGANLRGANLSGVKLSKEQVIAILETAKSLGYRAPLAGVDFSDVDLSDVDLSDSNLSRAKLFDKQYRYILKTANRVLLDNLIIIG